METEGLTYPDPPPECQEPEGQAASSNATSPRAVSLSPALGEAIDQHAGANVRAAMPRSIFWVRGQALSTCSPRGLPPLRCLYRTPPPFAPIAYPPSGPFSHRSTQREPGNGGRGGLKGGAEEGRELTRGWKESEEKLRASHLENHGCPPRCFAARASLCSTLNTSRSCSQWVVCGGLKRPFIWRGF